MYCQHWGLATSPFRAQLDARYFYESPVHEEGLARLQFLVENQRQLGFLTGPAGTGKSLLLEVFLRQLRSARQQAALVSAAGCEAEEFLRNLSDQMQLNVLETAPLHQVWQALAERVAECGYEKRRAVLLVDNADAAQGELLAYLARLAQFSAGPNMCLTLVLACRPERLPRVGERLHELVELRVELEPWNEAESAAGVQFLLVRAGGRREIFTREALAELHSLSHGVPRKLMRLADLSLLAGAGQNLTHICEHTVATVQQELATV